MDNRNVFVLQVAEPGRALEPRDPWDANALQLVAFGNITCDSNPQGRIASGDLMWLFSGTAHYLYSKVDSGALFLCRWAGGMIVQPALVDPRVIELEVLGFTRARRSATVAPATCGGSPCATP